MLDTVDNHALTVTENDIAVLSHQFYNESFGAQIPQLIKVLNFKMDNTLHMGLINFGKAPVGNVFPQYHAEIWCRQGAGFIIVCQVQKGQGGACGHGKAKLSPEITSPSKAIKKSSVISIVDAPEKQAHFCLCQQVSL